MKMVVVNDVVYKYAAKDPTAAGGAERYQWLFARALASANWSVTVGVREAFGPRECRSIDGVKFVGIGKGNILLAWFRFLWMERPDWWHWQCASHWLGPAWMVAKLSRVRTIFSAMNDTDVQPRQALFRRARLWPLYAWGLAWADRIIVQHAGQFSQLAPQWKSKASILPGIVDQTETAKPHSERLQYVAWVAVLRQPKRADLLIEIARKAPNIRFVVCGGPTAFRSPPGYSSRIISGLRAVPNIEYLGHVPPEKTQQIIANASLLLSTSDDEGYPSVFLEAWSAGTPVVSLTIDPDEVIQRKGLGVVSGNVDRAVRDINTLMGVPERREEMGIRARQHIREVHSDDAVMKAFESAIKLGNL